LYLNDQDPVELFLNTPHSMLEGRTPLRVALEDVDGANRVMKLLEQPPSRSEQRS
jgi:uncharacterized protein (DUF2384 family)